MIAYNREQELAPVEFDYNAEEKRGKCHIQ